MTSWKAQEKLMQASKLIASVRTATGNPAIRSSCNVILRPLKQLTESIVRVDFDKEDAYVLDLQEEAFT